uniref:Uncharacterized protein n=1 Tax=Anopheles culicifacies TaxID=139723 RepID=A0A182M3I4_9DIPT
MGGKQSRLQREQKHQQRKQKKEKKGSKRVQQQQQEEAAGSGGKLSHNGQLVVTAEHLVQSVTVCDSPSVPGNGGVADVSFESALNITERDIERVGRAECSTAVREDEEENAKSSVTITICMLKMEPNAAEPGADDITPTGDSTATVVGESDGVVAPAEEDVVVDNVLSRQQQCACFANGNFGSSAERCTESETGETVMRCSCNASAAATGSMDNRLNNNELSTPTTTSSTPAVTSTMAPDALSPMSSNLATVSSPSAVPAAPAVSFMIGGHDPATISHLLHRLRHLHHHHHHLHHHHHHHHLMHLHHLHHHHHPVAGGIADLPPDVAPSNTMDWRQQHTLHQWITTGMVGSSNGAIARPADMPSGASASAVGPTSAANASPLFMDIDIDLKDKLEGLRLGPAATTTAAVGQRSSNNNVSEESGEHPYSVGECPTCCAMAMAANASGTLGGLPNGSGAAGSSANGTNIYNGNAGEVEEKILNTSNQPSVTGGEKVPELSAPVATAAVTSLAVDNNPSSGVGVSHSTDQISTEPNITEGRWCNV